MRGGKRTLPFLAGQLECVMAVAVSISILLARYQLVDEAPEYAERFGGAREMKS